MHIRCVQEMRNNISEELERCEEELDREERYGGSRRSSDTAEFRDTLAGYKYVATTLFVLHTPILPSACICVSVRSVLPSVWQLCTGLSLFVLRVLVKTVRIVKMSAFNTQLGHSLSRTGPL